MHLVFLLIFLCNQELSSDKSLTVCRGQNSWQQLSLDWNSKYLTNSKRGFLKKNTSLLLFLIHHVDASFEKYPATFFYCLIDEMYVPYLKLWSEVFTKTNLILACTLFTWSYICICCLMPSIKIQQDSLQGTHDMQMLVWAESEHCPQISRQNRP